MMKLSEINYAPLKEMTGVIGKVIFDKFKIREGIFYPSIIILSVVFIGVTGFNAVTGNILFFTIVFLVGYIGHHAQKIKKKAWKEFGAANGWGVASVASNDPRYIPPGLFGIGHSQVAGDVIQASFEGHSCDIFSYEFSVGSGKSRKSYYYTIARVLLDKPFPHLVLDSKQTWSLLRTDLTTDSVKLEGNFSKYFNLYFKKNGQIDALSVITPDVMQTLIDSNKAQDIEIVGSNMFFMINSSIRDHRQVPVLLYSVDKLADDIKHRAKTIRYVPEQTEDQLVAQQTAMVAEISKQRVTAFIVMGVIILSMIIFIAVFIQVSIATSGQNL